MGRYISIAFHFERSVSAKHLLAPVFASSWFSPVALGGIAPGGAQGDHWLLAGYALEDFVTLFAGRGPRMPRSIEIASTSSNLEHQYLTTVAEAISQQKDVSYQVSPFEIMAPEIGMTSLPSVRLDSSILDSVEQWLDRFPKGELHVYGAVQIAVQHHDTFDWPRTFRFLFAPEDRVPAIGAPLLWLRVGRYPNSANEIGVMLYSSSAAWLANGQEFGGRVGEIEADINLAQLAAFAQLIGQREPSKMLDVELSLEGSLFGKERRRIEAAFANIHNPASYKHTKSA